ncbi:hypothetical protein BTVI_01027 [Pitangus sulphuratus]|nr:hypothetical protein BTVI_01027 [Pitangus sulphuratus]
MGPKSSGISPKIDGKMRSKIDKNEPKMDGNEPKNGLKNPVVIQGVHLERENWEFWVGMSPKSAGISPKIDRNEMENRRENEVEN